MPLLSVSGSLSTIYSDSMILQDLDRFLRFKQKRCFSGHTRQPKTWLAQAKNAFSIDTLKLCLTWFNVATEEEVFEVKLLLCVTVNKRYQVTAQQTACGTTHYCHTIYFVIHVRYHSLPALKIIRTSDFKVSNTKHPSHSHWTMRTHMKCSWINGILK